MKYLVPVFLLFITLNIFPACSFSSVPEPEEEQVSPLSSTGETTAVQETTLPLEPIQTQQPLPERASTPTPETDLVPVFEIVRPRYNLSASFNYYQRYLHVSGRVEYTNNSELVLEELLFIVDPNRYWNAFRLNSLELDGESLIENFELDRDRLLINLPYPLERGDRITVHFGYELFLPEIPPPSDTVRPMIFGYTERQANLVDWYPYIPPINPAGGWLANKPWVFGEHQVYEKADFFVEIETVSPPPELEVAASSKPVRDENTYFFTHENARNFVFSASHFYQVFSQEVGNTTVYSYAFPFDTVAGKVALQETAASLEFFNEIFGEYPRKSLSVVEADFLDGMEYDGLFFLSRGFYASYDGTPRGYLTLIAVHETAHQWWYGIVANDQAQEPWLDESLSTYSELLYFERYYPELVDWWWDFRIHFHEPTGKIDLPIYEYPSYLSFRNAVYLQGAVFLDEVRKLIGDPPFIAFLHSYAATYQDQIATGEEFLNMLMEFTSEDISELVEQFFAVSN